MHIFALWASWIDLDLIARIPCQNYSSKTKTKNKKRIEILFYCTRLIDRSLASSFKRSLIVSHNPKPLYFFWLAPWNSSGNQIPPVDQSGEPKSYTKCKEFFNYLIDHFKRIMHQRDWLIHRAAQSYSSVSAINSWDLFLNYFWPVINCF